MLSSTYFNYLKDYITTFWKDQLNFNFKAICKKWLSSSFFFMKKSKKCNKNFKLH